MSAMGDRRGRMAAQMGQFTAEAREMADDSAVAGPVLEWRAATVAMVRMLLEQGIPKSAIMGAVLAPTVDVIIEVRDAS